MIDSSAHGLIQLNERLRSEASGMQNLWRECGRMCLTRKVLALNNATSKSSTYDNSYRPDTKLLNSVAVEANASLASGLMSWVMPFEGRWFTWKPAPEQDGNDALEEWLGLCTDIALNELAQSNFYSSAHEVLLDRGTFGTAALWMQEGKRNTIMCKAWDAGTYTVMEDEEQYVTAVPREFELTALQAKGMFGDNVSKSVQSDLAQNKPEYKRRYLHVIFEREDAERLGKTGPMSMLIESTFICLDDKEIVSKSGFEEMPSIITRHLRWSEASAYGVSPAMVALAEIRGVNYLELLMATLAETQVNPRMILPQGYEGTPDLTAGGVTMGGMDNSLWPREWMTQGRVDFGLQLIERKEEAVKQAFHSKLFDLFSNRKGDLNIPHVQALQAEQLGRVSPAFTSLTTGFINPSLERAFMILFRAGKLPQPPREALTTNAMGAPVLLYPQVVQTNRMSQEMQAVKQGRYSQLFQLASIMAAGGKPEALDNFDGDFIRELATDAGFQKSMIDTDSRDAMRKARAEAQAAREQQEMMMELSKSKPVAEAVIGGLAQ